MQLVLFFLTLCCCIFLAMETVKKYVVGMLRTDSGLLFPLGLPDPLQLMYTATAMYIVKILKYFVLVDK